MPCSAPANKPQLTNQLHFISSHNAANLTSKKGFNPYSLSHQCTASSYQVHSNIKNLIYFHFLLFQIPTERFTISRFCNMCLMMMNTKLKLNYMAILKGFPKSITASRIPQLSGQKSSLNLTLPPLK